MIDILLATYQGEEYVEEQIDSIKNQSILIITMEDSLPVNF